MEIIVLWFACAGLIGFAASTRKRNAIGWFLLASLLSPIIAGLLLALMPHGDQVGPGLLQQTCPACRLNRPIGERICGSCGFDFSKPAPVTTRACPFCAEDIKVEAKVCKHCGRDLEPA